MCASQRGALIFAVSLIHKNLQYIFIKHDIYAADGNSQSELSRLQTLGESHKDIVGGERGLMAKAST